MMGKLLSLLIFVTSCTQFIQSTDEDYFKEIKDDKANELNILFTHNINGETHPCGCRNFPLGGLPQAYGLIHSMNNKAPTVYVDSGDTFFQLPIVPDSIRESVEFTATKMAEALNKIGLNYLTPGDQDFALGEEFLIKVEKSAKFRFLITNDSKKMKLPHTKMAVLESKKMKFYFIGVTDPDLLKQGAKSLFSNPQAAIQRQLEIINKDSGAKKIILLSHSGIDKDKMYAKLFPEINWIIGAHSQSYLYSPVEVKNTKLVQVLSRNHFVGHIKIPLRKGVKEKYEIIEMRDDKKDLVKNNPLIPWLEAYKVELDKIHEKEQGSVITSAEHQFYPTHISCTECHTKQSEFWQKTSHSIALTTLINAKAANNPSCIECHSLGYKNPKGFISPKSIIISDKKDFNIDTYWNEFSKILPAKDKSVRKLSSKERKTISDKWFKFDEKNKVTHNFSNVQCLNCHNQTAEHPFDVETEKVKPDYEKTCLSCHTKDQSPSWYNQDSKKLATSLNKKYFQKKLKQVSCPKVEK